MDHALPTLPYDYYFAANIYYLGNYSFILAWTFITLQIKEFRNMAFYINDSIFGSIFFFLTGLHFFHVIVGIILKRYNNMYRFTSPTNITFSFIL